MKLKKRKKLRVPWNKGLTKETDERVAKSAKRVAKTLTGKLQSQETKNKRSIAMKWEWSKPGVREKRSSTQKTVQNRSEVNLKRSRSLKKALSSPKARKVKSEAAKESLNRPEVKARNSAIQKVLKNDPEYKKHYSEKMKEIWADPVRREKRLISCRNLELIAKRSEIQKANWENPQYIKKQMKARNVRQNKQEKKLEQILNKLYPNEYKFVGHGEVVIGGKCPDFINVNGQKKIIELFGDYWHRGQDPQDRIDIFKPYGFDTLVIWERELKDIEWVKFRIRKFQRKENCHNE